MEIELLTPKMVRNELICEIAYRRGGSIDEVEDGLNTSMIYFADDGSWLLCAEFKDRRVDISFPSSALERSIDWFSHHHLAPMATEFSPVDPELGVWAQFCEMA